MYFIKNLVEKYHDVWIRCDDKHLQKLFLLQAECEGFHAINGQKPTELNCQELYGISDDMTMGYLSSMVWSLTKRDSNDKHVRIDFGKYIAGLDAVISVERIQIWKQLFDENGNPSVISLDSDNAAEPEVRERIENLLSYIECEFRSGL